MACYVANTAGLDVQICAWAAGCVPGMLPARVGPDETVRTRDTLLHRRTFAWTAHNCPVSGSLTCCDNSLSP